MDNPKPLVDLSVQAPEWSVVCGGPNEEYPDRVYVYQNGVLVVDAVNDIPTYDALSQLVNIANTHSRSEESQDVLR